MNVDEYKSVGNNWIALHVVGNIVKYFDSFLENIPKEINKFLVNQTIITNIYRTKAFDSMMCGYFVLD